MLTALVNTIANYLSTLSQPELYHQTEVIQMITLNQPHMLRKVSSAVDVGSTKLAEYKYGCRILAGYEAAGRLHHTVHTHTRTYDATQ